jgi:hypothetical protein
MRKSRIEYDKLYRSKNAEKMLQSQLNHYHKYPERRILRFTKYHAKRTNQEFNLEESDIKIPTHCPYLGVKITTEYGDGRKDSNASIDKIDPARGYIKGNVQIISFKANRMKNDATKPELLIFAQNIINMYKES